MSTLVIHPHDPSTEFLSAIYEGSREYVILRDHLGPLGPIIREFDRVIMLGHGSPQGLFSVGKFPGSYAIDCSHVEDLRGKPNLYVWCHASSFVHHHGLSGLSSGMFISEVSEAQWAGIPTTQRKVDESNRRFAESMRRYEHYDPVLALREYYDPSCAVTRYNLCQFMQF